MAIRAITPSQKDQGPVSPEVSVIIPTWKGAAFIGATIESILRSTYPIAEVVVVDDGSPDDTAGAVARYGSSVRLLRIANSGTTAARAAGIAATSTPWLAFCDHDDIWQPDHLARLMGLATEQNVPFAFSNFLRVTAGVLAPCSHFSCDSRGFWEKPGREVGDGLFVADAPLFPDVLAYQVIYPSCSIVSRAFYERLGGLNAAFGRNVSEDLEFTLRCVREAPSGIDTRPTVHIMRHGANYSGDWIRVLAGSIEILKFAAANHGLPATWVSMIDHQIVDRSVEGIDHAFLACRFEDARQFARDVPLAEMSWKTKLKAMIVSLPPPAARFLSTLLTSAMQRR
jgi:glycosyltransferase involved in cell wall biosynthesis